MPEIVASGMYHFFDETDLMGFELSDGGLQMVLAPAVPEKIEAHFPKIVEPFLEQQGVAMADVQHLILHPGGKKILTMVESLLAAYGKNVDLSREVLRQYGNMSSATVLYVLKEFLRSDIPAGDYGLMLSFGPGFTAQRLLLRWES